MKRFILGLTVGVVTTAITTFASVGIWVWHQYSIARPAIVVDDSPSNADMNDAEFNQVVSALENLHHFSYFFGIEELSSFSIGSAGAILGMQQGKDSLEKAELYFKMAIVEAKKFASEDTILLKSLDKYDPLLETYFHYGLFLKDAGENQRAEEVLTKALQVAKQGNSESHWIRNIESVVKLINRES